MIWNHHNVTIGSLNLPLKSVNDIENSLCSTYSQLNDGGTESRDEGGGVNDVHAVGKHCGHPRSRQGERGPDEGPTSPVPYEEARDEASEKGSQK